VGLESATSHQICSALDRAGVTWSLDDDGDIRVRFRSGQQPWTDAVFYEFFDTPDGRLSIRGQFLNGRAVQEGNGRTRLEVPSDGPLPTAVAQKVVTVYLMPRRGALALQIHAAIAPLGQPRPMHIRINPGNDQLGRIERTFPGFSRRWGNDECWMSGEVTGGHVDEETLLDLLGTARQVGLEMFDHAFTGWMYGTEV
jgi:hypothetical protein